MTQVSSQENTVNNFDNFEENRSKVEQISGFEYTFIETLDEESIDYWWGVYEDAFSELNRSSPERQTMHKDEFAIAMVDPEVYKLGLYNQAGDVQALTIFGAASKSDVFGWLSQDYFAQHYPDAYRDGSLQYFVTTLTRPEFRDIGAMASMGQTISDRLAEDFESTTVIFDCSTENRELPKALYGLMTLTLEAAGLEATPLDEIGAQYFYGFSMNRVDAE